MKTVKAVFGTSNNPYTYYVPPGDNPKPDDLIMTSVQMTAFGDIQHDVDSHIYSVLQAVGSAKVAKITEVGDDLPNARKMYLALISAETVKENYVRSKEAVERAKLVTAARKKLDDMLKTQHAIAPYRQLAATSPEAAELLKIVEG